MGGFNSTQNTLPGEAEKRRPRDNGALQVDIAALDTRKMPAFDLKERQTLPASLAAFPFRRDQVSNQAIPYRLPGNDTRRASPLAGKFGGAIKIVPFPAANVPTQIPCVDVAKRTQVAVKSKKSRLSFLVRLGLTLLLFAFLFRSLSWSSLLEAFNDVSWGKILVSLVVGAAGVIASAYQWRSLLLSEKIRLDLARLINLYMVGIGFSHFLPTGMGGDAVKALYVGREASNSAGSVSAVVMCRVTGFIGMLLIAWPVLLFWHESFTDTVIGSFALLSLLVGGMIAGAFISVALLPKLLKGRWSKARVFASVMQVGSAMYAAVKRPRSFALAIGYGVVFQIIAILNCYAYAEALGIQASLHFYFVAVPLIALVAFLPISINGYGLRESTYVYIFSTIHISPATALLLALLQDAQTLVFGVIGGCIYLKLSGHSKLESVQGAR